MPEPTVGVRYVADDTAQMSARLAALRFVLDCHESKEATGLGSPDDAKGSTNDRAGTSIPDR